jgi:GntR family transcriptional repressor for pyruvate dehydrogenase complex
MAEQSGCPQWRPVRRVRAFEEVLGQIEEQIAAGTLRVGDRLPGERELASRLGVSRPSVREAMRVLETLGVVSAQTGSGPDAGAQVIAAPATTLANLLRLNVGLANFQVEDVVESRMMLERWSVRAAATHADAAGVARMRELLDRMRAPGVTTTEFNELDTAFHQAIAETSGNPLIGVFMRAMRESVRRYAADAVSRLDQRGETIEALVVDHAKILAAIESGDPEAAADALDEHLRHAYPDIDRIR